MPKIEKAQQALDIIKPIPAEKFITWVYGKRDGSSCVLGHIHRALSPNGSEDFSGDSDGFGLRELSKAYVNTHHPEIKQESRFNKEIDIADVNNWAEYNGWKESEIKDRVVHFLEDMVAAGY